MSGPQPKSRRESIAFGSSPDLDLRLPPGYSTGRHRLTGATGVDPVIPCGRTALVAHALAAAGIPRTIASSREYQMGTRSSL